MGNVTGKALNVVSRRAFTKGSVLTAAFLSSFIFSPATVTAAHRPKTTADALLHLNIHGVIEIHSGGGHVSPYGDRRAINIVSEVLDCSDELCKINYGDNPAHLPAILGQFSNHLSFTNEKTNRKAAEVLVKTLKQQAVLKLGGKANDYQVANGFVFNHSQSISFKEIASAYRRVLKDDRLCENTLDLIKNTQRQGICVAVGEIS